MNLEIRIHGKDDLMFFFPYIAAQIEEAKATITQLEEELRAEELLVINKKEYNRLAKNISLHKSRRELTQWVSLVKEKNPCSPDIVSDKTTYCSREIDELEQKIAELEQQISTTKFSNDSCKSNEFFQQLIVQRQILQSMKT